ncbi:MAG: DUF2892 domain-containing protein [Gammaproteobacteria bacterium]|nr:DUF2892 domain-containing protein [Gammaproteobacteria bacterium]MBU2478799.1 DUF2892 domain-containing protein [Gammaproteobacteria bacterium]
MSERVFRFILGAALILLLYLQADMFVYAYIGVLLFEGITNWRVPILVSKLRYGKEFRPQDALGPGCSRIPFDAERTLRLLVAAFLILTFIMFPEQTWFFPWFIGFMLFMAGLTNICPMVMGLRWAGFR